MHPRWRNGIITAGAVAAALWLGLTVADGRIGSAAAVALVSVGVLLAWGRWARVETLCLAFVVLGYVVGNRGFAQILPLPGFPLLFGEAALALGCTMIAWRCAFEKRLPFRRDGLNVVLLALLALGAVRMLADFPRDRFLAVRDFATIYYIGFFFIAQELAAASRERRYLLRAFAVACMILPWTLAASRLFPEFFLQQFTVRGIPLIFYKDDLAATFLLAGVIVLLESPRAGAAPWRWFTAAAAATGGVLSLSRAALAGLIAASAVAAGARRRRFLLLGVALAPIGVTASIGFTLSRGERWEQSKVYALYEHAVSIADITGAATYVNDESADSGHNNRFRLVWWRTIIDRVLAENPLFGMGFGFDLARDFVAAYHAVGDDFDTRSPHSILFTIFGRMGLVGLMLLLAAVGFMARRTWREIRRVRDDPGAEAETLALWCAVWVIFVSACFGVVLEGPMGAVVFWTLLGLAAGRTTLPAEESGVGDRVLQTDDCQRQSTLESTAIR
jgi:O-antigen ligase